MKGTSDGWAKPKWISNIFKQEDYLLTLFSNYGINPIVFAQISVQDLSIHEVLHYKLSLCHKYYVKGFPIGPTNNFHNCHWSFHV